MKKILSQTLRGRTDLRLPIGIYKTCYLVGNEGEGKEKKGLFLEEIPGLLQGKSWKNEEVCGKSEGQDLL